MPGDNVSAYRRIRARVARAPAIVRSRRFLRRALHRAPVLGPFRRTSPYSGRFGFDRGTPVDRVYIERFLEANADDVRGSVLEVGDRLYTQRFGGSLVLRSDVVDVDDTNRVATIIADLSQGHELPAETYDCIICTQVLQLIWDIHAAVRTLHGLLRPGGVLLLTMPGITQIDEADNDSWYWAITRHSAVRLLEPLFGKGRVTVEAHGSVASASAFLYGLAAEELRPWQIDARDERYDVLVTVRATKAAE